MLFFLQIKYKEEYEKTKGKATETKDSRLLHSLKVAKMSSEVNYFSYSKGVFHNYKSSNITMPSITVTALLGALNKIGFLHHLLICNDHTATKGDFGQWCPYFGAGKQHPVKTSI